MRALRHGAGAEQFGKRLVSPSSTPAPRYGAIEFDSIKIMGFRQSIGTATARLRIISAKFKIKSAIRKTLLSLP